MGVINNLKQSLDPYFITGFADAEGSFIISLTPPRLIIYIIQYIFL
jgi:hypothetical protein